MVRGGKGKGTVGGEIKKKKREKRKREKRKKKGSGLKERIIKRGTCRVGIT